MLHTVRLYMVLLIPTKIVWRLAPGCSFIKMLMGHAVLSIGSIELVS